jgi:hypothetical protein
MIKFTDISPGRVMRRSSGGSAHFHKIELAAVCPVPEGSLTLKSGTLIDSNGPLIERRHHQPEGRWSVMLTRKLKTCIYEREAQATTREVRPETKPDFYRGPVQGEPEETDQGIIVAQDGVSPVPRSFYWVQ